MIEYSQLPADWIPYKLDGAPGDDWYCKWLHVKDIPFTDPFFDETILKARIENGQHTQSSLSSLEMLPEWAEGINAVYPTAFVFHVSRCGSTLISQMLSQMDTSIVLAEVPFFDDILRLPFKMNAVPMAEGSDDLLKTKGMGSAGHSCSVDDLLQAAIRLYGRRRRGDEQHLFIKVDSWHLFFYDELRRLYPDVPFILLYRTPSEVIRSHEKRRGLQAVPGMIEPALLGLKETDFAGLSLNEYMAKVLEKYYAQLLHITRSDPSSLLLSYHEGPAALVDKTLTAAGIRISAEERDEMLTRSRFNAKNEKEVFAEAPLQEDIPSWLYPAFELYGQVDKLRLTIGSAAISAGNTAVMPPTGFE